VSAAIAAETGESGHGQSAIGSGQGGGEIGDGQMGSGEIAELLRAASASGRPVTVTITERGEGGSSSATDSVSTTGASLKTTDAEAAAAFDARGAKAQAGKTRAGGGGVDSSLEIAASGGVNALHVIGGLAVIAAAVVLIVPPRNTAAAMWLGIAGGSLIAAGTVASEYPWILAAALVAGLGALAYVVYASLAGKGRKVALDAITPAIEDQEDPQPVKDAVAEYAGPQIATVRAAVRASKAWAATASVPFASGSSNAHISIAVPPSVPACATMPSASSAWAPTSNAPTTACACSIRAMKCSASRPKKARRATTTNGVRCCAPSRYSRRSARFTVARRTSARSPNC